MSRIDAVTPKIGAINMTAVAGVVAGIARYASNAPSRAEIVMLLPSTVAIYASLKELKSTSLVFTVPAVRPGAV
jgi:hypothetical protein